MTPDVSMHPFAQLMWKAVAISAPLLLTVLIIGLGLSLEAGNEQLEEPGEPDNAYVRVELAQVSRQLGELVAQLPDAERRVIFRHYFQQQAFEEIARGLNLSKGRVSQIHHAALRRLRAQLRKLRHGDGFG